MRPFDWDDVRFFLAVARCRTISVAARTLKTDHTTVGRRIHGLEDALRTKLFDRSNSGYALTDKGRVFIVAAEAMERSALVAQADMFGSDLTLSGAVRVGAPDGFGSFFLAPRIGAFSTRHPELEVQIIAMPRIFSLSKREADIAITLAPPTEGRLLARKVTDYKLGLYASTQYLAAAPKIRSRRDLKDHPFIGYTEDHIFSPQLDYLKDLDDALGVRLKSSNLVAQLNATRAGAGICVLPYFLANADPNLQPVLPDKFVLQRSFWLTIHEDQKKLARVKALSDFICREARLAHSLFLSSRPRKPTETLSDTRAQSAKIRPQRSR